MTRLNIEIPDEVAAVLAVTTRTEEAVRRELLFLAALKLYELGRLSSGAAARMADMPRTFFLVRLREYGVDTFTLSDDELKGETRLAEDHL